MGVDRLGGRVLFDVEDADDAVVAGGGEQLAVRRPGDGVDQVGMLEVPRRGVGGDLPLLDGLVRRAGEDFALVGERRPRAPRRAWAELLDDLAEVVRQRLAGLEGDTPGGHRLVVRDADESLGIGGEGEPADRGRGRDGADFLAIAERVDADRSCRPRPRP